MCFGPEWQHTKFCQNHIIFGLVMVEKPVEISCIISNFILSREYSFFWFLAHNSDKNDLNWTKFGMYPFQTNLQLLYLIIFLLYFVQKYPFWRLLKKGSLKNFNFFTKWKPNICSLSGYGSWLAHIFFLLNTFPDRRAPSTCQLRTTPSPAKVLTSFLNNLLGMIPV